MEFLHIDLQKNDSYQPAWEKNTGATKLVLSNCELEGANDKATIEGYIVAMYDENDNLTFSTDVPEPVVVNLEGDPASRITGLDFADFDELEESLSAAHNKETITNDDINDLNFEDGLAR